MYKYIFVIDAFDGEGGGATAGTATASAPGATSQVAAGNEANVTSDAGSDTSISFEDYRKSHKEEVDKWFNKEFGARHRDYKQLADRAKSTDEVMDMLATRFGIEDRNDFNAITEALRNDDFLYAERAEENNRTIDEQRQWDQMERENRQFRENQKRMRDQQNMQRQMEEWERQSNNLKQIFPGFDLDTELQNPEFQKFLRDGYSMERAFYALHGEDITTGAMQYTANAVRQATAEDLSTRRNRPRENALSSQASAKVSKDLHNMTKQERAAMAARSMRESIRF